MMTRKDYVATATILNRYWTNYEIPEDEMKWLVVDFCEMFASDNPNFNREKFKEAVYK